MSSLVGGADRDRTDDLKLAKLALSQLSYGPDHNLWLQMVGPGRVERPTSRLSGVRSNHLSYEPDYTRATSPRQSHTPAPSHALAWDLRSGIDGKNRKGNEGGGSIAVCLSTDVWDDS